MDYWRFWLAIATCDWLAMQRKMSLSSVSSIVSYMGRTVLLKYLKSKNLTRNSSNIFLIWWANLFFFCMWSTSDVSRRRRLRTWNTSDRNALIAKRKQIFFIYLLSRWICQNRRARIRTRIYKTLKWILIRIVSFFIENLIEI